MNPVEFKRKWTASGDGLKEFKQKHFADINLPSDAREFLIQSGLPLSAAPFFEFDELRYIRLQRVTERHRVPDEYSTYRCIGYQKPAIPICVSETDGTVSALNDDNNYRPLFINSSIAQFAASLLAFRDTVVMGTPASEGIYYGFGVPVHVADVIRSSIQSIDPIAISPENFWPVELARMVQPA